MGRAAGAAQVVYSALPVRLAPGSAELRYLHVRQHRAEAGASSDAVAAAQRTLFVACIPARCAFCPPQLYSQRTLTHSVASHHSYGLGGLRELLGRFGQVTQCSQLSLASLPAPAAHVEFSSTKARACLVSWTPGAPCPG